MTEVDTSSFYEDKKRLEYNPVSYAVRKRKGFKRLVAFDDRFEEVKKTLENLIMSNFRYPVKILDVGVGDGAYEATLDKDISERCEFYGVDISMKQMARAKKFLKETKTVDLNRQKLPYRNGSFDIVIASEILEHVFHPEKILQEALRVLRLNGFLVLTFPNSSCLQLRLGIFIKGDSPLLNYPQNKEHIRFFTSSNIQDLINSNVVQVKKLGLGSFLFDKWNFLFKIPMPRLLQVLGNKFFPGLALGNLLVLQKK